MPLHRIPRLRLFAGSGLVAVAMGLCAAPASAATNLVSNGDFETGTLAGWTLTGADPASGFELAGVDGSGLRFGDYSAYFAGFDPFDTLSQTLSTVSGQAYTVSFHLGNEYGGAGAGSFEAWFGGTRLFEVEAGSAFALTPQTFRFTATGASTELSFRGYNNNFAFSLDNVSVTAVPEPSTLLMLLSGLLGVGLAVRRRIGRPLAAVVGAAGALVVAGAAQAVVPTPTVTGPIASDVPGSNANRNWPFFATDIPFQKWGYVEEEFFYEGTANTYANVTPDNEGTIATTGNPYKSRLLVRRPASAARFNGVVLVEWLNVTNGYDTDVLWLYQKEFLMREGYAWVGVSAQNAGLSNQPNGLKNWSPTRYGTLNVNGGGSISNDALSYDIYSQAAAAVRNVPRVLGNLPVQLVIAGGQSQSANRMATYFNGPHPKDPIYDAALLTVWNNDIRADNATPMIKVLSETEANTARNQRAADLIRVWPVAGASHSEQYSMLSRAGFLLRDLGLQAQDTCATPPRSRVEIRYVYNRALDALVKWARNPQAAPATAPMFQYNGNTVVRDARGMVLGGIRLAEIEAPVAVEAANACNLGGMHIPFDTATLNALYPTKRDYVNKVTLAARASVAAGFVTAADSREQMDNAARSIYGEGLTCGALCADVKSFPLNPSSMLLRNQTAFLLIHDDEPLLRLLDEVTRSVAKGDTATATVVKNGHYNQAVTLLEKYIAKMGDYLALGNTRPEVSSLMINQATTLKNLIAAQVQ